MSGTRYEKEWRILYVWDPMQKAGGAASLYDLILIYHGGGGGGGGVDISLPASSPGYTYYERRSIDHLY